MLLRILTASVVTGALVLACRTEQAASPAPSTGVGASHQIVAIDPQTGQMVSTPPGGRRPEVVEAIAEQASTSHEGLELQQSPVDGGGEMVDVSGRFRSLSTVTVGADGRLQTHCRGADATCRHGDDR